MNKSLVTNIIAIGLIVVGFLETPFAIQIKTMGFYSFSGAITNWLAIHMLFEKVPFLYGSGVIALRFEEFKLGIKNLMMDQFFTEENLKKFSSNGKDIAFKIEGESVIDAIDFDKVFVKLKSAIIESPFGSMLGMFGGEQALEPLKPLFAVKFKEAVVEIVEEESFTEKLIKNSAENSSLLDSIEDIVEQRLNELTPQMVKDIIQEMIREHLGWLVVWGGVFGAVIGLVTTAL